MFKPMLAGTCEDTTKLNYPVIASPKLDGIRCTIQDGVVYSRNLKPIPSELVQKLFGATGIPRDGELVYGDPCAPDCFRKTTSAVMSQKFPDELCPDDLVFYTFDMYRDAPFQERYAELCNYTNTPQVKVVPHHLVTDAEMLTQYEHHHTEMGYEGVMVRSLDGPYKQGRSTLNQGYLLKIKQFKDSEAEVLECVEQMHNENEPTIDELGHTKRSHEKAGMVPAGVLGALRVRDVVTGVEFSVGSGFTGDERDALWAVKETLIGKFITYKYFPVGVKDKPRFPTYKGFRDPIDF